MDAQQQSHALGYLFFQETPNKLEVGSYRSIYSFTDQFVQI